MQRAGFVLPLMLCTLTAGTAFGASIFNDIPSGTFTVNTNVFYGDYPGGTTDVLYGVEFETSAGGSVDLSSVEAVLSEDSGNYHDDDVTAYLYGDTGTGSTSDPGTDLDTIATDEITNYFQSSQGTPYGPETYTFTPTSTILLSPDTQYWIVLKDDSFASNHSIAWWETNLNSTNGAGVIGASGEYSSHTATGGAWVAATANNAGNGSGYKPTLEVSVSTPAPEPATTALAGAGLLAMALILRRRGHPGAAR